MQEKVDRELNDSSKIKRGIKICITAFFILFIIAIAGSLIYLNWILKTPVSSNSNKKYFEIKKDQSTIEISKNLQAKGFIKSDWIFSIHTKIKGKILQVGMYEMPQNLPMIEVFDIVSNGKTEIVIVTIPEGYRTEQIGQLFEEKKVGSYEEFIEKGKQYEGKLFPDTYYISPEYSTDKIIETMLENYKKRTSGLTVVPEDLIIASIVEREAVKDPERPIIAGVYKNRIERKMKLEADPTVQYGKDNGEIMSMSLSEKLNYPFWGKITKSDYTKVKSSYNTYIISGLPPGPICNPGIKSIEATLNYTHHDYLYFLQDGGKIYLGKTQAEHQQNIETVFGTKQ